MKTNKIYCNKKNCKHIGRKSGAYRKTNGDALYCCNKAFILISDIWDIDKEIQSVTGEIAICSGYEPIKLESEE